MQRGLSPLELAVGFVDSPQQLVERRRVLDRPDAVERRSEQAQVTLGEQGDGDDPLAHVGDCNFIQVRKRPEVREVPSVSAEYRPQSGAGSGRGAGAPKAGRLSLFPTSRQ